jgi:hypothetical protein
VACREASAESQHTCGEGHMLATFVQTVSHTHNFWFYKLFWLIVVFLCFSGIDFLFFVLWVHSMPLLSDFNIT